MNTFPFTKMHSLGNDFVVINAVKHTLLLSADDIRLIADRRYGIGCDQLLLVGPPQTKGDFSYSIFNADGHAAQHCGNGARCLAQFVKDIGLSHEKILHFELPSGEMITTTHQGNQIAVDMGAARLESLVMLSDQQWTPVYLSNPHAITTERCDDLQTLSYWGEALQKTSYFPEGVNVTACVVQDRHHIMIQTYERGVGLTPACGSAACAATFALYQQGIVDPIVTVEMPGGTLIVECLSNHHIILTGPTTSVFEGVWYGKSADPFK